MNGAGRTARLGFSAPELVAAGALLAAVATGFLVARQPLIGIALVVALAVVVVVATDVHYLPVFLVATIFVESLSFGPGLRIGRIAAVFALAVVTLHALSERRLNLKLTPLVAASLAFGFVTLLSVYWASDSGQVYTTFARYALVLAYMLAFAVIVESERDLKNISLAFAIGALIFGLVSFASYIAFQGKYLVTGEGGATGLQGDHVYFGIYQVLALPMTLVLAAREPRAQRRLLYFGISGVIVLSVVASLSRTGMLALAGVIVVCFLVPWRLLFRAPGQKLSFGVALMGAAAVASVVGAAAFVARAESILHATSRYGDKGSGRTDLWRAALHGFRDHPWFGLGAGNFQSRALDLLQTTPGVDTTKDYVAAGRVVHNSYLEAFTELGVVGGVLFVVVCGLTAWTLLMAARRARAAGARWLEQAAVAFLISFFGLAISMFFASLQYNKPLWIFIGIAVALDRMTRRLSRDSPRAITRTAP